jgi:hypothetical protein
VQLKKILVLRSNFTGLKLQGLVFFVENVLLLTLGIKKYESLQEIILEIQTRLEIFKSTMIAAENEKTANKTKREAAYNELIAALHIFSSGLEFFSKGDVDFIDDSGMSVNEMKKTKRKVTNLLPPQFTKIVASKTPGHVDLEYTQIEGTKVYGFEYSEDQITWKNGQYSHLTSASILIPTRKDVWIRVHAIGVHKVKSEYSAAVQIFIA